MLYRNDRYFNKLLRVMPHSFMRNRWIVQARTGWGWQQMDIITTDELDELKRMVKQVSILTLPAIEKVPPVEYCEEIAHTLITRGDKFESYHPNVVKQITVKKDRMHKTIRIVPHNVLQNKEGEAVQNYSVEKFDGFMWVSFMTISKEEMHRIIHLSDKEILEYIEGTK